MKKIRFGIVGVGNQGTYYAQSLFAEGQIENGIVSAICDLSDVKIATIQEKLKDDSIQYFKDYKEMVNSGVCDAVLVETPHYSHTEIVTYCLEHGMPVVCEKPAGVYTKEVREMNEIAAKCNTQFGMMFNQRTNCVYRKMREIIAEGGIGDLQRVTWIITNWYRTQNYYDSGSWRATWDGEGGGVLINQSPHQIDLFQWIVGKMPKTVRGFCQYGKWHNIEVEDEVTAFVTYDNGATGVFITTTGEAPGTNRFEISGTKGKLLCENNKLLWYKNDRDAQENSYSASSGFTMPKSEIIEVETDGKNPQHAGIINNFANALLGLEPLFVDGQEGFNGVELMNAIELSGWKNGEEITLPVNEDEYLAELNKRRATSKKKTAVETVAADMGNTFGTEKK